MCKRTNRVSAQHVHSPGQPRLVSIQLVKYWDRTFNSKQFIGLAHVSEILVPLAAVKINNSAWSKWVQTKPR